MEIVLFIICKGIAASEIDFVLIGMISNNLKLPFQVRERLRVALERCSLLEEELGTTHKEVGFCLKRRLHVSTVGVSVNICTE